MCIDWMYGSANHRAVIVHLPRLHSWNASCQCYERRPSSSIYARKKTDFNLILFITCQIPQVTILESRPLANLILSPSPAFSDDSLKQHERTTTPHNQQQSTSSNCNTQTPPIYSPRRRIARKRLRPGRHDKHARPHPRRRRTTPLQTTRIRPQLHLGREWQATRRTGIRRLEGLGAMGGEETEYTWWWW